MMIIFIFVAVYVSLQSVMVGWGASELIERFVPEDNKYKNALSMVSFFGIALMNYFVMGYVMLALHYIL